MSKHIKQHYVPQFFLRNFSDDERLCPYNLNNEQGYPPTPIKNICYEKNFYGDKDQERVNTDLENEAAPIIQSVVDTESLQPAVGNIESHNFFDLFISHLYARTKAARVEADAFNQEFLELLTELGVEAGELDQEHLEAVQNGQARLEGPTHAQSQLHSMFGPIYFCDLSRILIKNESDLDFIVSDSPVVFDNPRYKNEVDVGVTGYSSPGLQILCPLSSDLLLMMFDPETYSVRLTEDGMVRTNAQDVVEGLNKLQLISSLENCYYRTESDKKTVDELHQQIKEHRGEGIISRNEFQQYDDDQERYRHFVTMHSTKIEYSPPLPFVKQKKDSEYRPVRDKDAHELAKSKYDEAVEDAKQELGN